MSLATMKVVSTVALPLAPTGMDVTASGDSLLLAFPELGALGVIDLRRTDRRLELLAFEPVPGFPSTRLPVATEVRALANGKAFVAVSVDPGTRRLLDIDLATGTQRYRTEAGANGNIGGPFVEGPLLTRSGDGSTLVVRSAACVQRYGVAADQIATCVAITPLGIVASADASGQRFAVGPDIYDASWQHVQRVERVPTGTVASATLTPDGRELFFIYRGAVVRANAADGRIVDRQMLPVRPDRLRLSADGRQLIATGMLAATGNPGLAVVTVR
jgi:hypothetical protein